MRNVRLKSKIWAIFLLLSAIMFTTGLYTGLTGGPLIGFVLIVLSVGLVYVYAPLMKFLNIH